MKPIRYFLLISMLFSQPSAHAHELETKESLIVAQYSEAWNKKDLNAMAALMHPDIEWLSVEGSNISVESKGKTNLLKALEDWLGSTNLPKARLHDWSINGNYVAVTETASWTDKSQQLQSQSSLTVYELKDKLIIRVYYYPSQKH